MNEGNPDGRYVFFTCAREDHRADTYSFDCEAILVAGNGFFNAKHYNGKFELYQRTYAIHDFSLNGKYLYYALDRFLSDITKGHRGSTIRYIRIGDLTGYVLPIPPLPEQRRIVAKIEELFSQLDAGVEELKKAKAQLKRYRQSVLKAAFEGKLTEEWRKQNLTTKTPRHKETATELLDRIREGREKALGGKYKEPPPLDMSELPELPEGWAWARLGDILADDLRNGRSVKTRDAGFPVLRLSAVRDGKVDLGDFKLGDWDMEDAEPFLVRDGDFLIARGNGSLHLVGRGGLVRNATRTVAYPDTLIRARVLPLTLDAAYLALVWESQLVRRHMERRARTTAGIYKISQPDIEQTIVPLAPVSEQCQIARQVEDVFSIADAEEKAIEAALRQAARLRQSILKRAFEGRLVPQDPSDEPADRLLERIRAEKAKHAAGQSQRRGRRTATAGK